MTRTADVDRAVEDADRWADRLDIVVNNAGITGRSYPIWELTDEDWHQVLAVDLTSVFLVCRAAVRLMRPRRRGRIVNIASIAGKEGNPTLIPYSSAKAGVIGLTKALAKECRHATAFCPCGGPRRHRHRAAAADDEGDRGHAGRQDPDGPGRHAPAEVATLVAWLASRRVHVHHGRRARSLGRPGDLLGAPENGWKRARASAARCSFRSSSNQANIFLSRSDLGRLGGWLVGVRPGG